MTNLSSYIYFKYDNIVNDIDVLGINGDMELQTMTNTDESTRCSLQQNLYITDNNKVAVRKALEVVFV